MTDSQGHPPIARQFIEFSTPRLRLRQWTDGDREPFAAMGADAEVMRYFSKTLTRAESDQAVDRWQREITEQGWGLWAAELAATGQFLGFVGLSVPSWPLPFMPCVEVGWRLAKDFWGRGLASEAARGALAVGFEQLELSEIVSFTALANSRSIAVMERIGMRRAAVDDFDHPALPAGHPLRPHCLYRLTRPAWQALAAR